MPTSPNRSLRRAQPTRGTGSGAGFAFDRSMATTAPSTRRGAAPAVEYELKRDVLAGILAGQIAGLIMAVAMVLVFVLILRLPWYHPVQVIGSAALGDRALPGAFHLPGFLAGLALHQLVAALVWSLAFSLLINRLEHTWANVLAVGLAVGALSHVIDTNFIVPAIMNGLHGHNLWAENVPRFWSWIAHLVYGLSMLSFLPIWQKLPAGRTARRAPPPDLGHPAA